MYQRWIYRVDMSRVNEFGFSGQQAEERAAEAAEAAAAGGDGSSSAEPNGIEVRQCTDCCYVARVCMCCSRLFCAVPKSTCICCKLLGACAEPSVESDSCASSSHCRGQQKGRGTRLEAARAVARPHRLLGHPRRMEANKQRQLLRQTAKSQNSFGERVFGESEDMRIGHCAFMPMGYSTGV